MAELTAEAKKQLWDAAAALISGLPDTTDENADTRTYGLYTKMKARSEARLRTRPSRVASRSTHPPSNPECTPHCPLVNRE